ncbi:terminase large subunit [Anaeromyxobacter sp. PSR-1]|uniref:terminase large subunit n=1 Tax=Anaeromyxobacter sp. PSR-1 TaxID=1300915 RepID=UPI0005E306DA|nr:terminase TerL endonuclease subunit [Anaeromyxobacter sp. PSR-1]GAO01934.1 putative terminase large subunit [Anaeromyxobacter sp. PSR-1]
MPKKPVKRDYSKIAKQYAREVIDGKIVACKLTVGACKRFLNDLERSRSDDFPFKFDQKKAAKACTFIECLPRNDVPRYERIHLEPWQVFIVANLFGWVDKRTDLRRFLVANIWMGKGNGKSFLAAPIGIYMAFMDGEMNAEVLAYAFSKEGTDYVWKTAKQILEAAVGSQLDIAKELGIELNASSLLNTKSGSVFKPKTANADSQHGSRPNCLILDELHVLRSDLWDALKGAIVKRKQALLLTLSTGGFDTSSIGYGIFQQNKDILEGKVEAEETFTVIYQAETDDIADRRGWLMANPNLGVSVYERNLEKLARDALAMSQQRGQFIMYHLNRWAGAAEGWMAIEKWDACADQKLSLEQFKGQRAFIGLDPAAKGDIFAIAIVFVGTDEQGRRKYTAFFDCHINENSVAQMQNAGMLRGWGIDGHLTIHTGDTIDQLQVAESVADYVEMFPGSTVCFDPAFGDSALGQVLMREGIEPVEVRTNPVNMNRPMTETESAVLEKRLVHTGNPAVSWQIGNVVAFKNRGGLITPDRSSPTAKIDAATALFTAMALAQDAASEQFDGPLLFRLLGDRPENQSRA